MLLIMVVFNGPAHAGLALRGSFGIDVPVWDIELSGGFAYLAADLEGLIIVDVSDPAAPVETARLPLGQSMVSVVVRGDHAVTASGGAMLVVDIAAPSAPTIVGSLPVPAGQSAYGVAQGGPWVYVSCSDHTHDSTIMIVDLASPSAPVQIGQIDSHNTYGVAACDGLALLSGDPFTVVDVSDPSQPATLATMAYAGADVVIDGTWAYLASWGGYGLMAIDIGDPSRPVVRSAYAIGEPLRAVAADGGVVALAGLERDVWIFEQDPSVTVEDDLQPAAALDLGAWPNPFNPATTLHYAAPAAGSVDLTVHDMLGRVVRHLVCGEVARGGHEVVWHGLDDAGRPVPSGVYLAVLRAGEQRRATRLSLVK